MKSSEQARVEADSRASARRRWWSGLARTALGVGLLAALVFWGQFDLRALLKLTPSAVMSCLAILLVSIPIAAVRCAILLRVVGVSIRFVDFAAFRRDRSAHQRPADGKHRWRCHSRPLCMARARPQRRPRRVIFGGQELAAVFLFISAFLTGSSFLYRSVTAL